MATKTATVTARVVPEIKQQAECVLEQLGIPVSVLIDSLYRQIIMTGGIPYPLTVSPVSTRDALNPAQFDVMMETGLAQAKRGQGLDLDAAFARICGTI